jgi:hypothetical protein
LTLTETGLKLHLIESVAKSIEFMHQIAFVSDAFSQQSFVEHKK